MVLRSNEDMSGFPANKANTQDIGFIVSELSRWCDNYRGFVNNIFCEQTTMEEKVTKLFWCVKQIAESQLDVSSTFSDLYEWVANFFGNLDVQDEINQKIDDMINDGTLGEIITKITQTYVINVVWAGCENDGTDISSKLQILCNNNPGATLYFPKGTYTFYEVNANNNSLKFAQDAIVNCPDVTKNCIMRWDNQSHIIVEGGKWRRGTNDRVLVPFDSDNNLYVGVLRFYQCHCVTVRDFHLEYCSGYYTVVFYDCDTVLVEQSDFNHTLQSGVWVYGICNNVAVRNCTFTNALLCDNLNSQYFYTYTILTGRDFNDSRPNVGSGLIIENCLFENCEWEGIDSHGFDNVIIRNNKVHNSPRFITAYYDNRWAITHTFYNTIIENNYCYNDDDYAPPDNPGSSPDYMQRWGISTFANTPQNAHCISIKNNTLINAYVGGGDSTSGVIRVQRCKNVQIINNYVLYTSEGFEKNTYMFGQYADDVEIAYNQFLRLNCTNQVWYLGNSHAHVHHNVFSSWNGLFNYIVFSDGISTITTDGNIFQTKTGAEWSYDGNNNYLVGSRQTIVGEKLLLTYGNKCVSPGCYGTNNFTAQGAAGSPYITVETTIPVGTHLNLSINDTTYDCIVVEVNGDNVLLSQSLGYSGTYQCKTVSPVFETEFISGLVRNVSYSDIKTAVINMPEFSIANISVSGGDLAGEYIAVKTGSRVVLFGYGKCYKVFIDTETSTITEVKSWDMSDYPVENFK